MLLPGAAFHLTVSRSYKLLVIIYGFLYILEEHIKNLYEVLKFLLWNIKCYE